MFFEECLKHFKPIGVRFQKPQKVGLWSKTWQSPFEWWSRRVGGDSPYSSACAISRTSSFWFHGRGRDTCEACGRRVAESCRAEPSVHEDDFRFDVTCLLAYERRESPREKTRGFSIWALLTLSSRISGRPHLRLLCDMHRMLTLHEYLSILCIITT